MAIHLSLASGPDAISVRHFSVSEALSTLFDISVVAVSPLDDIDFESVVGHEATLRVEAGELEAVGHSRTWVGVCCHFEQLKAEESGLSTYLVRIVPKLWLLSQRHNRRIFQHASTPEIVKEVLAHWKIEPVFRFSHDRYPQHEYRVQYDESDLAFVSRLLEEAGITYYFAHNGKKGTELILTDEPHRVDPTTKHPLPYVDAPNPEARKAYLTNVTASREIRPGAYAVRDYDFRRNHDVELAGKAKAGKGLEAELEQYHYRQGSFVIEGAAQPQGHAHGTPPAHADEKHGQILAHVALQAERASREVVGFESNLIDLAPGTVFHMSGHPRASLAPPEGLLSIELQIEATEGAEWHVRGRAVPTSAEWRPAQKTPLPRARGVESAVVVGPHGEEIHTDAFGRVKLQFHWDRHGKHDDHSSCWVRVAQGWAGAGYGSMILPRVGQEVTVAYFDGNPDQPVVIGRVYNMANGVPYKLPDHKTRSTLRSASTPGGERHNEILFEDEKGAELVSIHAARDMHTTVRGDEVEKIGGDRTTTIGGSHQVTVGGQLATLVGARHNVTVSATGHPPTSLDMTDGHLACSTGEASVRLEGAHLFLEAKGNITIVAHDGDVVIKGGPNVKINCE